MNGFNEGIEAAAKRLREISHEGLKDSWWRERFESAARSVEALKRPEPSEEMADLSRANSPLPGDMAQTAYPEPEPGDPAFKGLKPCPFCGESMCFTWVGNADDSAEAMEAPMCACGAQGPMYPTRTDAIAAWNKRPEPSEGERVEKVAAVIERELMIDESLLADPATLRKIKSQRIARAALKAMEVAAGRVELEERGKPGVVLSGFNDGDGADVEAVLETTCAEEQASKWGLWDADNADFCEGCGNGDKVPANGYWRCPKCDAEWPGDEG